MNKNIITLPGGYFYEGSMHREVRLKPITGRDEEMLAEMQGAGDASITTAILANCIKCLCHLDMVNADVARSMVIADRDFLLMNLYQLTFGDKVEATVTCAVCNKKIDVEFLVTQIEVIEMNMSSQVFTMELSPQAAYEDEEGRKHESIEFRLPNGGDLEAMEDVKNEAEAMIKLLSRCIMRVGEKRMNENIAASLTALAKREIEVKMSELAPRVELDMDITCPECQHSFTTHFNIGLFFSKSSG